MSVDNNFSWHFDNESGEHEGPNDIQELEFAGEDYPTLIRESIQNSLDAVLDPSKPVVVNIRFRKLDRKNYHSFFELEKHIQGCIDMYGEKKATRFKSMLEYFGEDQMAKIGYVTVSDSNTTGMKYAEGDTDCEFYAFALSKGVSNKTSENTGGAFGFGKTAYFRLSPIRTILVSTCYHSNNRHAFIGISRLCTHQFEGDYKTSVGYFGKKTNNGKIVPETDESKIPKKFKHEGSGTSISIIGVNNDENSKDKAIKDMVQAVLRYYWLAIWEEKLVVEIEEETINKDSIVKLMENTFPDEIDKSQQRRSCNPRPYFDAVRFADSPDRKDCVCKRNTLSEIQDVELYIKKNKEALDRVIFMRRNLMYITWEKKQTHYGYNALFVCRSKRGDRILKELENPRHDEWKNKNRTTKLSLKSEDIEYKLGDNVLEYIDAFITTQIESLFHLDDVDSVNIVGLEDLLYVPEDLTVDDDFVPNPNIRTSRGKPIGGNVDEGSLPSPIIENPPNIVEKGKDNIGHVIVVDVGTIKPIDKSDEIYGIGNSHPGEESTPTTPEASDRSIKGDVVNIDEGTFLEYIPVTYKVVAQQSDCKIYHDIIFHSPKTTDNGEIKLVIGGEQSDEKPQIVETSMGKICEDIVSNLHISEGKNVVRVRFDDNLKHVIILKAYETKR